MQTVNYAQYFPFILCLLFCECSKCFCEVQSFEACESGKTILKNCFSLLFGGDFQGGSGLYRLVTLYVQYFYCYSCSKVTNPRSHSVVWFASGLVLSSCSIKPALGRWSPPRRCSVLWRNMKGTGTLDWCPRKAGMTASFRRSHSSSL